MEWTRRHYGKACTIRLPSFTLVLISDPEAIRGIFAAKPDDMHAGSFNRILRPLVGDSSVLLLDGAPHMRRRKLLLPPFHGERMRVYGETMAEITQRVVASWPTDTAFALHPHTQEITLQVILRSVFGAQEGAQLDALRQQIKALLSVTEHGGAFVPLLYLALHPEAEAKRPWKWLLRNRDRTDTMLHEQIAARRAEAARGERKDVLSLLLCARDEAGEGLCDREVRDELMTALAAGHETTATALAWAVERILAHPSVYRRLTDEVRAQGRDPDPEWLATLPYLDATLKETLRLRPVIPLVGRVLRKPHRLAGYDLPSDTAVGASIYLAQRDPDVYLLPEAFRPERFLNGAPDAGAYLPFGGGIRRCIGMSFALYEMKIVLGTMLARCDLELAQDGPSRIVRRAITFYPQGGTRIRARPRGDSASKIAS
jgi:cytochrome P450